MKQNSVIFIGSADFGKISLERIVQEGYAVKGVITEVNDPCAAYAKEKGIPTIQLAERHRKVEGQLKEKVMKFIDRREPDFLAMCVWEKQMPSELVKQYAGRFINFHGSPLPLYRGWAPINWQIIRGKKRVGMSVSFVAEKYDRGPIVQQNWLPIDDNMTAGDVYDLMELPAAEMICRVLYKLSRGKKISVTEQPQTKVLPEAPEFTEEDTRINWRKTARQIHNLVRGCNPMDYAHTTARGEKILIASARIMQSNRRSVPGQILSGGDKFFTVACGRGNLLVYELLHSDETPYDLIEFQEKYKQKSLILGK